MPPTIEAYLRYYAMYVLLLTKPFFPHPDFFIPLVPFSLPHFLTLDSKSHLTNTIAKLITQLRNVSSAAKPFLRLPPSTLAMTSRVRKVVDTISSPLSSPA